MCDEFVRVYIYISTDFFFFFKESTQKSETVSLYLNELTKPKIDCR